MIKSVKDFELQNKKVLLRVDFNVPIKDGVIQNDNRITSALQTIKYIVDNNAKLIIFSHLGRIKSAKDFEKNNLNIVAQKLQELLNKKVVFVNATRGIEVEQAISNMQNGDVVMLQNTRYEDFDLVENIEVKNESKNNAELAKYWASLGDVFINDAFAVSHRECASICGIAENIKQKGAGFLLQKELEIANNLLGNIKRPYVAILGGSKVADKIGVINSLLDKADKILIGGAMMFTFLKAKGYNVGASKVEDEEIVEIAKDILNRANGNIILPIDCLCNSEFKDTPGNEKNIDELTNLDMGLDIGSKTLNLFKKELINAKTVVWNGPLGVFEMKNYANGTKTICEQLCQLTDRGAITIVGGGDTVSALEMFSSNLNFTHISTGGGAFLELLEGKILPGVEAINNK